MNTIDIMNHALRALDGPGVEPKLWSNQRLEEMRAFCKEYLPTLELDECDELLHDAYVDFYTKIARHADRNKKLVGIVLG